LIHNSAKAYNLVKDELASADRETLVSIMLDAQLYLIGIEVVAVGNINACGATNSEIFKSALLANSSCIILCHNHPSGNLEPSPDDIAFTKNLIMCGNILGIKIYDHIVVSSRGFTSMYERGLFNP